MARRPKNDHSRTGRPNMEQGYLQFEGCPQAG